MSLKCLPMPGICAWGSIPSLAVSDELPAPSPNAPKPFFHRPFQKTSISFPGR